MFNKVGAYYRFLSREFLAPKRIRKIASGAILTVGVWAGFLLPETNVYANVRALNQLSTAQFTPVETSTSSGFQFPLKNNDYVISQFFSSYHPGVDLDTIEKTPVYPIAEGEVKQVSRWWIGYGHHLIIDHGNNLQSLYAHLSTIEVKVGDKVGRETLIGRVGSTGWTTGDHLHLEIYDKGRVINPLEVLSKREN